MRWYQRKNVDLTDEQEITRGIMLDLAFYNGGTDDSIPRLWTGEIAQRKLEVRAWAWRTGAPKDDLLPLFIFMQSFADDLVDGLLAWEQAAPDGPTVYRYFKGGDEFSETSNMNVEPMGPVSVEKKSQFTTDSPTGNFVIDKEMHGMDDSQLGFLMAPEIAPREIDYGLSQEMPYETRVSAAKRPPVGPVININNLTCAAGGTITINIGKVIPSDD